MSAHTINIPAYHVWEFQQELSEAGVDYVRLERTDSKLPFAFEIRGDADQLALAKKLLASLEIYTSVIFANVEDLQKTIRNAESYGLEVSSITVSSRILDKPRQYRLEMKGSEGGFNRLKIGNHFSSLAQMVFADPPHVITASRGGSGRGTVAYPLPAAS